MCVCFFGIHCFFTIRICSWSFLCALYVLNLHDFLSRNFVPELKLGFSLILKIHLYRKQSMIELHQKLQKISNCLSLTPSIWLKSGVSYFSKFRVSPSCISSGLKGGFSRFSSTSFQLPMDMNHRCLFISSKPWANFCWRWFVTIAWKDGWPLAPTCLLSLELDTRLSDSVVSSMRFISFDSSPNNTAESSFFFFKHNLI